MINILTLFRQRRLPRQQKGAANGSWHQRTDLNGFGTNAVDARREAAKAAQIRNRQHRETPADPQKSVRDNYLAAHGLEKSYGGRKVVSDVSVYVRRGEAVGLLGPNGAGKTTVFYMITGLVKADRGIDRTRRLRRHPSADVSARAARHRLPAAGSLDFPRPQRRGQHPLGAGGGRARRRAAASATWTRCSTSSTSPSCASRRRSRCRAASGAACEIARALASRPKLHAARRAVRRHRSDRGRRHPASWSAT